MEVALLTEGVDRNVQGRGRTVHGLVALLTEGVDRNLCALDQLADQRVALLTEGVDRNDLIFLFIAFFCNRRPPHGGRG